MITSTAKRLVICLALHTGLIASAQSTWSGGGAGADWGTSGNWDLAPSNGDSLTFGSAFASGSTLNNNALTSVGSLTFNTSLPSGGITLTGNALTLNGNLTNNNATSGRNVTLGNDLAIGASTDWVASSGNAITLVTGDLSGSANLRIQGADLGTGQTVSSIPNIRFYGDNSAYMGNIDVRQTGSDQRSSITLSNPGAQTAGNIRLSTRSTLGLEANASAYTFGIGTGANQVDFRGESGLLAIGGDVTWDPGNGGSYTWSPLAFPDRIGVKLHTTTGQNHWVNIGTSGQTLTFGGGAKTIEATGSTTMIYTLGDDGSARNLTKSGIGVLSLQGGAFAGASTGTTTVSAGALELTDMNQISNGNLNVNGGVILFNSSVGWAEFAADRPTYGTGANQWQGGGFAARGVDVTIPAAATSTDGLNRSVTFGVATRNLDGSFYATGDVNYQGDTVLSALRTLTVAATGPGRLGSVSGSPVYEISGDFSGAGGLQVVGTNGTSSGGILRLSGSLSTTGNVYAQTNSNGFNTGPGGVAARSGSFLEFASPTSLPTGAPVNTTAYIAGLGANNGAAMEQGILFAASGTDYVLNRTATVSDAAYKVIIGGNAGGQWRTASFGASGTATLASDVLLLGDSGTITGSYGLIAHEGEFTLGTGSQSTRFVSVTSAGTADNGIAGAANTVTDASSGVKTIIKSGEGTATLENIAYTNIAGSPVTPTTFFAWQIGRGASNTLASPYFDGAVRETGGTSATSLTGFNISLRGGVLESSDTAIGGSFTRALGTGTTQVSFGTGGGGFSAGGGNLTVNIGGGGSLSWNATNFVPTNNPLMFGSQTADAIVTFQNGINLAGATQEIRVYDNGSSLADKAVISGVISGSSLTSGFNKTGDGRLDLSGPNTYLGVTTVRSGTLALTAGANVGYQYVVNGGTSFIHSGGTWVMGADANNLFHVNGSGGAIQVADLADANDGSGVIRFTMDTGGVSTIELTDNNPFAQYNPMDAALGRDAWASEWTLDLNAIFNLSEDFLPATLNLMKSTAYDLNNLNNKLSLTAWTQLGAPTTYNNLANGQSVYINTGVAIAEYSVSFTETGFDLTLQGSFAIPEPGTLSLVAVALIVLRRQFRKRCLAA